MGFNSGFKGLTNYMQRSPSWEGNRFWASQEVPRILWKLKFHFRIHKSPGDTVAQLVEALRYKPEGGGFDSRWC